MRIYFLLSLFLVGCASTKNSVEIEKQSLEDVTILASNGNHEAIHALCYRYMYGYDGAEKHYGKAFDWCQKSALNGNSSSITLLAEIYYQGHGIEQDYESAFKLYELAAKIGHPHAQIMLYVIYTKGNGVEKNSDLASYWLSQSAASGNVQAKRILSNASL